MAGRCLFRSDGVVTRKTLLDQINAIQMARTDCLLVNADPDAVVAGYFLDATGLRRRVGKARWRWHRDIAEPPPPMLPETRAPPETIGT